VNARHWFTPALVAAVFLAALVLSNSSCRKDDTPTTPPPSSPCAASDTTLYGAGNLSAIMIGAGGVFDAQGRYKPSSEFASDSSSMGVGGFVRDTTIGGTQISGQLVAYTHQSYGSFAERLLVFTLHDSAGSLHPGTFPMLPSDTSSSGRFAHASLIYTDDTLGIYYATYDASSGLLTISSIDTCGRYVTGVFDGLLNNTADTTHVQLTGGSFAISCVPRTFAP
jgi:hypothetical protein